MPLPTQKPNLPIIGKFTEPEFDYLVDTVATMTVNGGLRGALMLLDESLGVELFVQLKTVAGAHILAFDARLTTELPPSSVAKPAFIAWPSADPRNAHHAIARMVVARALGRRGRSS